jgi:HEAT repeat protein
VASAHLPEAAALDLALRALEHQRWEVRHAAAEALADRGMAPPGDLLRGRLQSEKEPLVRASLERLRLLGEEA